MRWNSITQIVKELNLESDPSDIHDVKKELKNIIAILHPDKSNGEFKSEADKEKFLNYKEAYEFCENQEQIVNSEKMLVPLDTVTDLVKTITQNLSESKKQSIEERLNYASNNWTTQISKKYLLPKISLGTVTAFLGFVFWFPETMKDHPYISDYLNSYFAPVFWAYIVLILSFLWVNVWQVESKSKEITSIILSVNMQQFVLNDLYSEFKSSHSYSFSKIDVTKSYLRILQESLFMYKDSHNIIQVSSPFNILLRGFYKKAIRRIDKSLIEQATDLAIEQYLNKGLIKKSTKSSVESFIESGDDSRYSFIEQIE